MIRQPFDAYRQEKHGSCMFNNCDEFDYIIKILFIKKINPDNWNCSSSFIEILLLLSAPPVFIPLLLGTQLSRGPAVLPHGLTIPKLHAQTDHKQLPNLSLC